ncbi:Ligand binding domain of hormone receptors protein [Tyrophagus putrescentiae]|nr:Ligand binding domain of hormone receptors protein [Tyrophagus putrescentiae]
MEPSEGYLKPCSTTTTTANTTNNSHEPFGFTATTSNAPEFGSSNSSSNHPSEANIAFPANDVSKMADTALGTAATNAAATNSGETGGQSRAEKPISYGTSGKCSNVPMFSSNSFQNSLNSTIQKAMYEMYNMSALNDSVGENGESMEARNSVLEAILEIEFCNIPLRQEVLDSVTSREGKKSLKYSDYLQIESHPTLHELESERLEELKGACLLLRNDVYKHVVHKTNQLVDAVKVTEAAIRRLIKMSKRLSAFNKLSQNDQISLLKGSIIEMMCIRATTNFNSEHNFWYFIDDINQGLTAVSLDVLKNANWINFMSHKNFAIKFNSQFKSDPMIADLLTAIILFRPSRASTSNQELIRDEFLNYCYLLKRYLYINSNGDKCKAKSSYIVLMHRLEELYYLAEDIVRIYLDMDPENAGPLFVELFDLK